MTKTLRLITLFTSVFLLAASAGTFVNGNFETGDATGWTKGGGDRTDVFNNQINVADFLPGGQFYDPSVANSHSGIVTPGLDPNTGNQLNRVYSGNYSWRVEDTNTGGFASVISQTVQNYTDPSIFFAWAAVLEGAHAPNEAATIIISLRDLTAGDEIIHRQYNAGDNGSGVDTRFQFNQNTGFFWTPWQIEQLALPQNRIGHDINLSVLAADCVFTGHIGYAYLDGFGAALPTEQPGTPGAIPEPSTYGMMAFGLAALVYKFRRRAA